MNEIETMLNSDAQEYYGGLYIDFQKRIIEPHNKFFHDYHIVCNSISEVQNAKYVVDIGAGNCRWFKHFENNVIKYFAIEVNQAALSLAPKNSKLILINKNIYDESFNLKQLNKPAIDTAFFGFFLSHFSDTVISMLLMKTSMISRVIIVDSLWGSAHQKQYKTKEIRDIKRVFSASEKVFVPKRFFEYSDIQTLIDPLGYVIKKFIKGTYWFVCIAEK